VGVYWAYVTYIDELYGKVLERLEQEELLNDTLVIMVTDHGVMNGQHGLHNMMCPYEEAVRVPFLMRLPGLVPAGWRCQASVSLVDMVPTILSIAGISPPADLPGLNLLELINDPPSNLLQRAVFSEFCLDESWDWHKGRDWRLVVREPWKFVFHDGGEQELYNLEEDPWEMENQAGAPSLQPLVEELREALLDWMVRTDDPLTELTRPWLDSRAGSVKAGP
jgi:arylsulfatase A-like enzyme